MPTVKTQDGKVVTKDGKVSCECCEVLDPCITSASSPPFIDFTNMTEITSAQYATLFASGTYSLSATTNYVFDATITDQAGTDPWSGSSIGSGATSFNTASGCFATAEIISFGSGIAISEYLISNTNWSYNGIFTRRLGTNASAFFVTFGGSGNNFFGLTRLRSVNPMSKSVFSTINIPANTDYTGNRPTDAQVVSSVYSDTTTFKVNGATIAIIPMNIRISTAGSAFPYSYLGVGGADGMINITESGASSYIFDFVPSAP